MASAKKTLFPAVWRWIIGSVVVLCLLLIAGWHFFKRDLANPRSKIAKPLLVNQIKKMLNEASDSLYRLHYSRFNLDITAGTGLITGLTLAPDSLILKQLIAQHKAPNNIFIVSVDSVKLRNFGFVKSKTGRFFSAGTIAIYHPVIQIINKRRDIRDSTRKPSLLLKLALKTLNRLTVKDIAVKNMTLTYLNENGRNTKHTALKNLDVNVSGVHVDSVFQVARLQFNTPDSLYHIKLDGVKFSKADRKAEIRRTSIEPRLGKAAFYKKVRYDKDRIHMVFNEMQLNHIDIAGFLRTQQLHIGLITTASSWGEVFNNYNWPRRLPPLRIHKYPHERLQQLALDITIDTFLMHKGMISYKMLSRKSREEANFFLNHSEGQYYNITNNAAAKKSNPYSTAVLDSRVMGAGELNAVFKFNLSAKNGAFSYTFRMGKMDGKALNPLAVPLALTHIDSANVDRLYLKVNADDQVAKGHIDLYYTDLKVSLLKPTLKRKKIVSFFANMALPNDNPATTGKFRKGPIDVSRDPRMSFLGFMYKSMLDGATSSLLGTNQHKDKADHNIIIGIGHKIAKPQKIINNRIRQK